MSTKKTTKRAAPKKHSESAEFYESKRGDLSIWSTDPTPAKVTSTGTVVFSIRLPVSELEAIRNAAAASGTTVSDLIRSATSEALRARSMRIVGLGECTSSAQPMFWIPNIALPETWVD